PSLQVVNRYWERVGIRDGIGAERTELRVFSLAEVPVGEFRAAKETALARLRGDSALQKTLAEIGKAQRDRAAE
ncbi:MAG: hypothetical protein ACXWPM_07990, partial [Bdellovibrionota bacterium]